MQKREGHGAAFMQRRKGGAKESSGLQEEAQGHLHHPGHWSATLMAYFKARWPNSALLLMASFSSKEDRSDYILSKFLQEFQNVIE